MPSHLLHRLVLCIGLPVVFGLVVWLAPVAGGESKPLTTKTDVELFRDVVGQMEGGQPYYQVFGSELRKGGYPAGSVFNWRQPLLYWILAFLGFNASQLLLIALSLALFVEAGRTLEPNVIGSLMVGSQVLLMALDGIIAPPTGRYFTELWAGVCIGLSALSYARDRAVTGAVWSLLALFIRELAAPYCVVATLLAVRGQRWREVGVLAFGLALYGIYYALHAWEALRHMQSGDVTHVASWLYWGGLPFLLKTWQCHGLLLLAPPWIFALAVVSMVVAWWAPRMPLHLRLSVLVYSSLFLAVGQPFNDYWGLFTAPLMAFWLAYSPRGFRELLGNAGLDPYPVHGRLRRLSAVGELRRPS
jgi:hypothetical protein